MCTFSYAFTYVPAKSISSYFVNSATSFAVLCLQSLQLTLLVQLHAFCPWTLAASLLLGDRTVHHHKLAIV